MRIINKIPINRILSKVYADFGLEEIEESTLIEWTGDVLSHLEIQKAYAERVTFVEIKNHQAQLPPHIISILRVAKNTKFQAKTCFNQSELDTLGCSDPTVVEGELTPCMNNLPLLTCCNSLTILPCGEVYRKPMISFEYPYYSWIDSDSYRNQFVTIGASTDAFKTGLICELGKDQQTKIYNNREDEYQIVESKYIRTNFKTGQLAIAYLAQPVDILTGYPLVPDDISVISAITNYILFMYCRKMHILGRPGYKEKYKEAEADYQWYLSQAKNKLYFPHGVDEFQKFTEARFSFLPNIYKNRNNTLGGSVRRYAQDDINRINRNNG